MFNNLLIISVIVALFVGCKGSSRSEKEEDQAALAIGRKVDYIRAIPGEDEEVSAEIIERGKVLISYSDCYTCHKENTKVGGPAFSDISLRYPRNEVFITILAQRIILGATGAWGHAVMSPHPTLTEDDAQAMVSYILSVKQR